MTAKTNRVLVVSVASTVDVKASLTYLLIGAVFASLLVPMLVSLYLFSTQEFRRRWLFHLNLFALLFGILQGVLLVALYFRSIVEPQANLFGFGLAVNIVFLFSPLLVESILLLRLVAVFPSRANGLRTLVAVLAFPVTVRLGRLINMCLAIGIVGAASADLQSNASQWWALLPYVRAEWFLALVDNAYVSLVFLYRLQISTPSITHPRTNAMAARVRRLFFIAVSNFLIPGLLNFIQIILIFTLPNPNDPPARQARVFYTCAYIMIVFNYICIVGVVAATIWSTATRWAGSECATRDGGGSYALMASPGAHQRGFRMKIADDSSSVDNQSVPLIGRASESSTLRAPSEGGGEKRFQSQSEG